MAKEKWYYVQLVFAQPKAEKRKMYLCETSNILIKAENASQAYDRAVDWAKKYIEESIYELEFVGIAQLTDLHSQTIKNGTEICGSIFKVKNIWEKKAIFIPEKEELSAFIWESNTKKTVGQITAVLINMRYTNVTEKLYC